MTYPEWQNSVYQNEREPIDRAQARTCQDCHMPTKLRDLDLSFRIANIEDETYPFTDGRAPNKDITLPVRDKYARHTLVALNQFGTMMFQQFPDILGIRTSDYMFAAGALGLITAQRSSTEMAREQTAKISVTSLKQADQFIEAQVELRISPAIVFRPASLSVAHFSHSKHWTRRATSCGRQDERTAWARS